VLLVVQTMRPRQWTKNAFVLAGAVFSGEFLEVDAVASAALAFAAFCLASGATYLLNDVRDARTDRLNPRTASRPIARGDLSPAVALIAALLTAAGALAVAFAVRPELAVVVGAFLVLQVAYSMGIKHVLFVDVMAIAVGFVLRVYGGIVAVDVEPSPWILLCTGLLALLIGLAKRRGEAVALGGESNPQRPVLDVYSVGLIDELISVVAPATLIGYALYTVSGAKDDAMLLTLPFVLYGIFRLLFLIHHRPHETEEPDVLVLRDRPLGVCVILWAVTSAIIVAVT
jgi:4-hydroxybenzoate polyprenyltransferase